MTNLAGAFMTRPRTSIAEPARAPEIGPAVAPRIEIVPTRTQKRARPKIAYAAVVVAGVLAIVVTQLLLSIGLSDGAYEISSLQSQQKELDRSNQVLSEQFDKLSSPQNLAASAESLGMVANSAPVYLRLSDGAVLGSPVAAAGTSVTGGQALVPNSLLTPPALAAGAAGAPGAPGAAGAAATAAGAPGAAAGAAPGTPSAPPAPEVNPDVPWQGALPSPTTR